MYQVGLTGGIASGKSTMTDYLEEVHHITVVDSDRLSRELVEPGMPALQEIIDRFGQSVISDDGTLYRKGLADIIFDDKAAKDDLENILHPKIKDEREARISVAKERGEKIIFHAIPLLFELDLEDNFDETVAVICPQNDRIDRLVKSRKLTVEGAISRIKNQISDEERVRRADYIVDNSSTLEHFHEEIEGYVSQLLERI